MNDESSLEVYRQRYETYRHLDHQRWQLLQLLVALGSGVTFVLTSDSIKVNGWFYSVVGVSLVLIASLLFRMTSGIRANQSVLHTVGASIGDKDVPTVGNIWHTVSLWITLCVGGTGAIFWALGVIELVGAK